VSAGGACGRARPAACECGQPDQHKPFAVCRCAPWCSSIVHLHATNALVVRVRDVKVATGVEADSVRAVQAGRGGGTAVAENPARPVPATVVISVG